MLILLFEMSITFLSQGNGEDLGSIYFLHFFIHRVSLSPVVRINESYKKLSFYILEDQICIGGFNLLNAKATIKFI